MRVIFVVLIFIKGFIGFTVCAQSQIESEIDSYINRYLFDKALGLIDSQEESNSLMQKKALCLKNLNKYADAITVGEEIVKKYPEDKQSVAELAICYQALSKWDKSLECYNQLINKDSTNIYFRIQRADMYMRQDKYAEALSEYSTLTEKYGMDNMLRKIAQCYDNLNMPDSARVYYNKSWSKDFFDTFSVAGLINLDIKKGKTGYDEAIRISDHYVERDSTSQQINLLNALSYYAADLYEAAAARFEKCYNRGDSSLVVQRSLGFCYYSLGQNDKAYTFLLKASKIDSVNINILYALGVVANERSDYDTGKRCFGLLIDRAVPTDFTLYQYYRNFAISYEGKEEFSEAVEFFKKAVEYANDNQKMNLYYTILSLYEIDLKQPREALTYYELYKQSLQTYYGQLLKIENPDRTDQGEINVTRNKLDALDKHINGLRKSLGLIGFAGSNVKVLSSININL